MILQRRLEAVPPGAGSLLRHRHQEHLWHEVRDLHHQLGDSGDGPFRGLLGAAEEIVEVNIDEKEFVGYLNAPNKDTTTLSGLSRLYLW